MCDFSFYLEKGVFVLEAIKKVNKSNGTFVCQNKMNSILFPINFTARDYDVFFTICWYAKQKDMLRIEVILRCHTQKLQGFMSQI